MEAAADAGAAASDAIQSTEPSASAAAEDKKVICRRCNQETAEEDALCQEKFRLDLRWTCKACHALLTQLNRHGVELKTVLSETESVKFFQDCKAARMNAVDKRLSYTQARGVLKQSMIESASRVSTEGEEGEFQPLSYWELKGYNTEAIEASAEQRTHPLLGTTYKVDIESTSTKRILSLSNASCRWNLRPVKRRRLRRSQLALCQRQWTCLQRWMTCSLVRKGRPQRRRSNRRKKPRLSAKRIRSDRKWR